jgi:hypothetical protein
MPTKTFKPSRLFVERVEAYRQQCGLQSWSAALVELATEGMKDVGIIQNPAALQLRKWGGDRKSQR